VSNLMDSANVKKYPVLQAAMIVVVVVVAVVKAVVVAVAVNVKDLLAVHVAHVVVLPNLQAVPVPVPVLNQPQPRQVNVLDSPELPKLHVLILMLLG